MRQKREWNKRETTVRKGRGRERGKAELKHMLGEGTFLKLKVC